MHRKCPGDVRDPTNPATTEEDPNEHSHRLASGVLHQDLIEAVEILCTHIAVPGSMAYQILVQASQDLRVSMRDLARSIVEAPEPLEYLRITQDQARQALADDAQG